MNKKELEDKIIEANKAYRSGNSIINDQTYDDLLDELKKMLSKNEYIEFTDTLNEGMIEYGTKIKHKYIAGSLLKVKYEEPSTVKSFLSKHIRNKLNISAKVDGLTGICHYKDGELIGMVTRGNGYEGISLMDKAKYIKFIPQEIKNKDELFIRGELVILKEDYDKITGTSPRNVVAGIINRKEWKPDEIKNISFVAYTIMGPKYCKILQFDELENLGFKTTWYCNVDVEECQSDDFIECLFDMASRDYEFATDGLVLSDTEYVNEEKYKPERQIAFKINQQKMKTRMIGIEWSGPSKDGRFSPIALLEPVEIGGVLVSKCTIHNLDFIEDHNLKIGDTVNITRSGDVIPKLIGVESTEFNNTKIEYPTKCPCCGSALIQNGPFLYCENDKCEDKIIHQIMHFIKKCGVEFTSFKTLKHFKIKSFEDLLNFKANKSYKSEIKFENEILKKIFTLSESDLFCKLNMKDIGETLLSKIVDFYGWSKIVTHEIESDTFINLPEGIGDITMNKFIDEYKKNLKTTNMIVSDPRYHYIPKNEVKKEKNMEIVGSLCFTGTLHSMTRTEATILAEKHGYQVKSSVIKGLTYLVTNEATMTTKMKKALQCGIKIINEEQFLEIINHNVENG